uniref:Uncharacterized protein n=1 Tax=Caldiarchaeum subterraneum TaxID=311458 RepID=A0A7C5Y942_CALS0
MSSVRVAKEELERLIGLCETIVKTGTDPYNIDVKALLSKLRSILEKARNTEILVLDAETLYRVALIVALQHRWLKDRAASLFVDSQIIGLKILSADKKQLAAALVGSWRPIVSSEQLTVYMFAKGLEHFHSLPTKQIRTSTAAELLELPEFKGLPNEFQQREVVDENIRNIHREMLAMSRDSGKIDYVAFISKDGPEKIFERAYLTAFVVSEGYAEISKNPITGEIVIIPYVRKRNRKEVSSLAITVQDGGKVV